MGRITIFTMDNSPNCIRTKRELNDRNIPFLEISLTKYPHRRNDMLSLSDKLTVPQMFINSAYAGGLGGTLKVLKSWERSGKPPVTMYKSLVESANDPTDPRLQPPTESPVITKPPPPRVLDVIEIPSCKEAGAGVDEEEPVSTNNNMMSILDMTELLKSIIPRKDLRYNLTTYKKSFRGCDFVNKIMDHFLITRDVATNFAMQLQKEYHLLHHVVNDHDFSDTKSLYFRLQYDQTPRVLNSYRIWGDERVDLDAMSLLRRLKKQLGKILRDNTDENGKVNYKEAANHKDFPAFEEAVCELQGVKFEDMAYNTQIAFGINLYNMMIKYAFTKVGIGSSALARGAFFSSVGFNLGGHVLTFQELENGVLRGNRKAPYAQSKPFSKDDDERLKLAMPNVDSRIHFALNCGANSCPQIRDFTEYSVQEELRISAQDFCEDEKHVSLQGNTLYLSKIFSWYIEDFGGSTNELAKAILSFSRGSNALNLRKLIGSGSMKVKYNTYDWGTDASDFIPFSTDGVKADKSRLAFYT